MVSGGKYNSTILATKLRGWRDTKIFFFEGV
jgi:hypothetical protein